MFGDHGQHNAAAARDYGTTQNSSRKMLDPHRAWTASGLSPRGSMANASGTVANGRGLRDQMSDPLMQRGNTIVHKVKAEAQENALMTVHATILAFVPWVFFVVSMIFTAWASTTKYAFETSVAYFVIMTSLIVYATAVLRDQGPKQTKTKWRRWAGRLTPLGVLVGMMAGATAYFAQIIHWQAYKNLRSYTNVSPQQTVDQFTDAGFLDFASGTTLDVTRAVGYKSAIQDAWLCVAPIVDGTMSSSTEINFFAVGINCCESRSSFSCDDATDGGTKSAMLILEPDQVVQPALQWLIGNSLDTSEFDAAIRMQTAALRTMVAADKRLVIWTKKPQKMADRFYFRGIELMIVFAAAYLVINVFVTWQHMFAPQWMRS